MSKTGYCSPFLIRRQLPLSFIYLLYNTPQTNYHEQIQISLSYRLYDIGIYGRNDETGKF